MLIFQLISVAHVTDFWKQAVVTPVHKKIPANVLTDYHPISVKFVSLASYLNELLSKRFMPVGVIMASQVVINMVS